LYAQDTINLVAFSYLVVCATRMEVRSMEPPKLLVERVSKTYRDGRKSLETLASIDLVVNAGEFVTVIGPSGCGKSTLFNIVAGVDQPTSGIVAINGDTTGARAGKSGYMPQQPLLLPWRSVEENVMLGLDVRRVPRKKAQFEARELLKRFGLAEFAQNYPATLSGGMRQRVALLRTVLFNSAFLLLDEPFGALDALTRLSLQMWLLELWQTFHSSVLFITHDVREAILLSDRIYVLSSRPARVLRVVEVDLARPRRSENLALESAVRLEQELVTLLMKEQHS
jgi:ABC-type nitrate/sulfonate/bicarbonate transport system ATPase subunit